MENQCESSVITVDGEDIVQCARPDTHAGKHRNWDKIKPEFPVEWATGQETVEMPIRAVAPSVDKPNVDELASEPEELPATDVMVSVAVYEGMVDALEKIAKGPDRFGGYGPSPDGNQTPTKIAKEALEGVDGV